MHEYIILLISPGTTVWKAKYVPFRWQWNKWKLRINVKNVYQCVMS